MIYKFTLTPVILTPVISTAGVTDYAELPDNAKAYIKRLEELVGVKITIISTGAERDETIVLEHPFA